MNNLRRKQINKLISDLTQLSNDIIKRKLDIYIWEIDCIRSNEQDAFDNLPESFQYGERGDNMLLAIDYLDEASSYLYDLSDIDDVEEINKSIGLAVEFLEKAAE